MTLTQLRSSLSWGEHPHQVQAPSPSGKGLG